jgi:hypothetical protein
MTGDQIPQDTRAPGQPSQRGGDLYLLSCLRDDLPTGHAEKAGVIRAIELLRSSPLLLVDPDQIQTPKRLARTWPTDDPRRDFKAAAVEAAFHTEEGRDIIHSRAGMLGADWDLDDVLEAIDAAQLVEYGPDILAHHLRVVTEDGRTLQFEVPMPGDGS